MSKARGEARSRRGRAGTHSLVYLTLSSLMMKTVVIRNFYQMEQTFEFQNLWLDLPEHDGEPVSTQSILSASSLQGEHLACWHPLQSTRPTNFPDWKQKWQKALPADCGPQIVCTKHLRESRTKTGKHIAMFPGSLLPASAATCHSSSPQDQLLSTDTADWTGRQRAISSTCSSSLHTATGGDYCSPAA